MSPAPASTAGSSAAGACGLARYPSSHASVGSVAAIDARRAASAVGRVALGSLHVATANNVRTSVARNCMAAQAAKDVPLASAAPECHPAGASAASEWVGGI